MEATQQTIQQIGRAINKVVAKYAPTSEPVMTDILLQVRPDSGELRAYNDDMEELTRIVVDQWLEPTEEDLYEAAAPLLKKCLAQAHEQIERMSILHPFSFVLIDDDRETISDLYLVDDDTLLVDTELMKGLNEDLNKFLEQLLKD